MALLSIAEPGLSAAPHQHRLAVGIDLGTTNSLVATLRDGINTVLRDEEGLKLLPSVVRYHADGSTEVGYAAREQQAKDPFNTLASIKRLMGRGLKDLDAAQQAHYQLVNDADSPTDQPSTDQGGMVKVNTIAGARSPVEVSAEILKVLRTRAEASLGGELVGAVITVPAYFDDAQRQATKDAARLAGLNVLRLLNEPTAAAVAYGLDRGSEGVYAVYDLGGGTFDISILRLTRGLFEVLAVNGDSALGGDDFDAAVSQWIMTEAKLDEASLSANDRRLILQQARHAKECVSTQTNADIFARLGNGTLLNLSMTREQFNDVTRHLVQKTLTPMRKALRDAELTTDDVQGVVLIGGSTRMLSIRTAVAEFFGCEPLTDIDPDEAVAVGAAIQANVLAGNGNGNDDWLLLDVLPLSLGLETMGGLVEKVIPRNSTLPTARAQDFTTFKDGQTAMALHVVQGERERVEDCRSLARFELRGIPPMAAGAARIRVTFQVDADGLLSVSAREQSTGVAANVTVQASYGLSADEVTSMLKSSIDHADTDAKARALREQVVEAQRLLESLHSALQNDRAMLSDDEHTALLSSMQTLEASMAGSDSEAIRLNIEALNQASLPFAARRMDQAVRTVMAGKQLTDFA